MDVQERLRELMTQRNWSAYRLAKQAGLSETTISNLFKRGQLPTIYTLERICDAFDITLCQFFAEENEAVTLNDKCCLFGRRSLIKIKSLSYTL